MTNVATTAKTATQKTRPEPAKENKKLTYAEQKELANLPSRIEKLEAEQFALQQRIASAEFYQQEPEQITKTLAQLTDLTTELQQAYQRWQELEKRQV